MKIVFFGTPSFVIPVLEALIGNFDVVGVVTTPDSPQGRKKILTPSPIKKAYQEYLDKNNNKGLIITDQQFNNVTTLPAGRQVEQLRSLSPDLFITAAYGHLIPENVLQIPKLGSLNIHPSLLPKYRGPSPIQTAILNGDKETGVTIIEMDEKLDHGPIIAQKKVTLNGNETFEYLHTELFQLAADLLPSTIEQLNNLPANGLSHRRWQAGGTITVIPQNESQATYCKKITKEDGYFDIDNPPEKDVLDRMIRAYYPWPTAWTKIKISKDEVRIMKLLPQKMIQLEGGKPMRIKDFLNGYPEMREILEKILNSKH